MKHIIKDQAELEAQFSPVEIAMVVFIRQCYMLHHIGMKFLPQFKIETVEDGMFFNLPYPEEHTSEEILDALTTLNLKWIVFDEEGNDCCPLLFDYAVDAENRFFSFKMSKWLIFRMFESKD